MRYGPQGKTHWKGESSHNILGTLWGQQVRVGFE